MFGFEKKPDVEQGTPPEDDTDAHMSTVADGMLNQGITDKIIMDSPISDEQLMHLAAGLREGIGRPGNDGISVVAVPAAVVYRVTEECLKNRMLHHVDPGATPYDQDEDKEIEESKARHPGYL